MCRITVTPDRQLTLDNTIERPDVLTSLSQLGPSASIQVAVFNEGPSTAPGAKLTITWPLRATASGAYILYPTSVSVKGVAPTHFHSHTHSFNTLTGWYIHPHALSFTHTPSHSNSYTPLSHTHSCSLTLSLTLTHSVPFCCVACCLSAECFPWSELLNGAHRPRRAQFTKQTTKTGNL